MSRIEILKGRFILCQIQRQREEAIRLVPLLARFV